jgi:Bacterial capsule synthesis protein PGA_cap/Dolichyl-phosphate-mannose-protein mannosyltransferase
VGARALHTLRASTDGHPLLLAWTAGSLALVRFGTGLEARELTLLESQDLSIAAELLRTFRLSADHSPLHFAFLDLWLRLAGTSVALLRLPSALFVAAATAVVFRLTERVSGGVAAFWAGLLFAANPQVVDQARSLRVYGLGILLAAVCLERAHAFEYEGRRERALFGFLAAAVLAVHTHLFLWLWALPLAALVGLRAFSTLEGTPRRHAFRAAALAFALMLPQIVHGFTALGFTHQRHAIYAGVSSRWLPFLDEIGRHLVLGESPENLPLPGYVLPFVALLPAIGVWRLPRGLRGAVLSAFGLPLVATFVLSFSSEVEPRYLCFALPELVVLTALGVVAIPVALGEGAAIALTSVSLLATSRAYGPPPSDWQSAAERLEHLKAGGDVVAVFPGYFAETFRLYTRLRDLVPVTYPIDLERALARGQRVFLVTNDGRYSADLDAYLAAYTERRLLFTTHVRDGFEVDELRSIASLASPPRRASATVVFGGLVGSGGYVWRTEPDGARAFDRVRALFGSADLAVTGYAPYEPPWPARCLLGPELSERLRPNRTVTDALARAGVRAVVVASALGRTEAATSVLETSHLTSVPAAAGAKAPEPAIFALGTERVALLSLDAEARDNASLVARTRAKLHATDGLVVFVSAGPSFDALPTAAERSAAQKLVAAGADVVIGNGGYVAKPIERYGGGVIAYSLGALLAPPNLDLVAREATGSALRVHFDGGRAREVDSLPLTFDDRSEPRLGRLDTLPSDVPPGFEPFVAEFANARASLADGDRAARDLPYVTTLAISASDLFLDREVKQWIPWTSRGTSRRPFNERFGDGNAYAGLRGVRSLGVARPAIELDAPAATSLALEFPRLTLGHGIEIAYALPDDREQSKYRPLLDEAIRVTVEDGPSFSGPVPFRAGWRFSTLDTTSIVGAERRVSVELSFPATHFPVAVALRLEP